MKENSEYIPVGFIDEFVKNLKMEHLNRKFIDKNGVRFVVRIGKESKRLEAFRIHSKSELEAMKGSEQASKTSPSPVKPKQQSNPKISAIPEVQKKQAQQDFTLLNFRQKQEMESIMDLSEMDLDIENTKVEELEEVSIKAPRSAGEERVYCAEVVRNFEKSKDRINSIFINIKNSKLMDETRTQLTTIQRDFEVEIYSIVDTVSSKYREITTYPKSINSYSSNYNRYQKDLLNSQNNEKSKIAFILKWEMQSAFSNLLPKLRKHLQNLYKLMQAREAQGFSNIANPSITLFKDAKAACEFCSKELDNIARTLEDWKKMEVVR